MNQTVDFEGRVSINCGEAAAIGQPRSSCYRRKG